MPRKKRIADKEIVEVFMHKTQSCESMAEAIRQTLGETEITKRRLISIIERYRAMDAAKQIAREMKEETYKDKIPLIKSIIGVSLETIYDFICTLTNDPFRKAMLTVSEVRDLTTIATDLNGLIRLEEGKSTLNIEVKGEFEHSHTMTLQALAKLKELDPVMEYPNIEIMPMPVAVNAE